MIHISEIATHYILLRESLEKLRDARRDKTGAVLGYVSQHYIAAEGAKNFLSSAPDYIKEKLGIRELEMELNQFGNVILRL